jgi:hypothetical protein
VLRLLVEANAVSSSPILVTLMMKALRFSETSVLTRGTRRNIPEDTIIQEPVTEVSGPVDRCCQNHMEQTVIWPRGQKSRVLSIKLSHT